jgi:hypothetical protein
MSNLFKKLFIFILASNIFSCGFQVIYRDKEENSNISYEAQLASIRIKKDRTRLAQELKNNLYDTLNPDNLKEEPKYFLTLVTTKTISGTFVTLTGASGRNKVTLNVTYTLQNVETGEEVSHGTTSVNDNYDVTTNRYGTYTAENYVLSNLTKIAAQNLRNSLVNDLIEMKKKKEKKDAEEKDTNEWLKSSKTTSPKLP